MSTLQVGNLHFESTGNNRIQYSGSNVVSVVVGGTPVLESNNTSLEISVGGVSVLTSNGTNTSINSLDAAGIVGEISTSLLGTGANSSNFLRGDRTFNIPSAAPTNFQIFLANGTYNQTSGSSKALVFVQGSGANSTVANGAGAGELRIGVVSPSTTETIVVGPTAGNASFGSHILARGGGASRATPTGSGGTRVNPFVPSSTSFGSSSLFGPGGSDAEPAQGYGGGGGSTNAGSTGFVLVLEYP
jgi:hypothetical protein